MNFKLSTKSRKPCSSKFKFRLFVGYCVNNNKFYSYNVHIHPFTYAHPIICAQTSKRIFQINIKCLKNPNWQKARGVEFGATENNSNELQGEEL